MLQNQVRPPWLGISMACSSVALAGIAMYGIVGVPVLRADGRLVGRAVGHERAHHDRHFGHLAVALVAQELGARLAEGGREVAHLATGVIGVPGDHDQQVLAERRC